MGDLGFNFISIPVHIIQDAAVQQQQYVTQSEVVPDNSTTIYIDQSQVLCYFRMYLKQFCFKNILHIFYLRNIFERKLNLTR